MSLKAISHPDLNASPTTVSPWKTPSLSSGNVGGRLSCSRDTPEETPTVPRPCRRPIRAVRPVSALSPSSSFLQISRLQGELVRKRKECEDLKQENKYLSNEIHMERIMMRTENELTMRNLRSLNQELQAQVKELKHKLHSCQQRATLCSRAAEEADASRSEAETARTVAEAKVLDVQREKELMVAEKSRLAQELQQLKAHHSDVQLLLTQTEKNYFETKLKLDRVLAEKKVLMEENQNLETERDGLRRSQKQLSEENSKLKEKEADSRHRAAVSEEQCERVSRARRDTDRERKLAEQEAQDRASEVLVWKEKHQALAATLRAQEDLHSQRQNKACQANIRSYFLCMTESDQRIKILKNPDGSPRNFTEGEPVYISTPDVGNEDPGKSQDRTMYRVAVPSTRQPFSPTHFCELPPMGADVSDAGSNRKTRKVVEYFWLPADEQ